MKNLKKVLAMVLAFACTFTMFASAKVYDDVAAGSEHSEAITMLSDLGIIQGKGENKYAPKDTITRAEACALIARLMTGDPNAAGFGGAHHFKDVVKGSWQDSAIGYCVVNGVAIGVDAAGTRFEPNRPIKDKEFVTMLVRALGYETPDMKKDFPFSYMSSARAIGLLENVNMIPDTDALRGEDAQVIYNALFADYARGAKILNTTHGTSVEKYPTIAESVWGLSRAGLGTFNGKDDEEVTLTNCKAHTWVIVGADKKEEGRILAYPIADDTTDIYDSAEAKASNGTKFIPYSFKYAGDADALKGYEVELWGEGKHGKPVWEKDGSKGGKFVFPDKWTIKAIKTSKGQTKYDYDASKADSKSDNGTIELGESKLDLKSVADNAKNVTAKNTTETTMTTYLSKEKYNGMDIAKDKDVEKALNIRDGAQYKLMDWDSDGDIDWIVVDEANYYKVESASSKRVTVTSMKSSEKNGDEEKQTASETQTWKLDDLNDEKNYKVKYVVPEGLKEGDILEVTYKTVYDKKEKCEVVTATVKVVDAENHELDKVSTKDHLVLTFDGETKQLAQNKAEADIIVPKNPTKYENFDEEELGTQFALYTNRNGFIVYSDYATETSNYLMVLDTDDGKNTVRGELGALKILTSDNKVENNVEVVSDLMIDRKTSGNGYDKDSRHFDEHMIVGNVYKYWKNADGKITKLESVVDGKHGATTYDYVSKNDRLTLDNKESYALKDAKVIFAVKPHTNANGYIQHTGADFNDLKVDEDDVLAVKQQDIPDIAGVGSTGDTNAAILDGQVAAGKSWLVSSNKFIAYKTQSNKDIDGAILGVDSFNKFNAGATKIGLVTDVSFGKGDVVSIEVATNGKVETLSSAEKTKFEDVVSVYEYANKKSYSLASRNETIKNGLAKGQNLKDYLNKNAAYAEITTNADGKLTGVLFMDDKNSEDAADGAVNAGNVVAGRYYQVSRKVIADVKEGKWLSTVKDRVQFTSDENLYTLDSKNIQKVSDLAGDVTYYTIDGRPTINGMKSSEYASKAMSILNGFDGNPTVKVGEASDVQKSEIRNDNKANDLYNVADVASKIDKNGEGDIVAVYAYGKYMGEDMTMPKPVVPEKKFKVTGVQFARADGTTSNELKTLQGSDNKFVVYVEGEATDKIVGAKMQPVGAGAARLKTEGVTGLTKENFTVQFDGEGKTPKVGDVREIDAKNKPGYYELTIVDDTDKPLNINENRKVTVSVVSAGSNNNVNIPSDVKPAIDSKPELGGGDVKDPEVTPEIPDAGSEVSKNVKNVAVKVVGDNLVVTPKDQNGSPISNLQATDFTVTINSNPVEVTATLTNATNNEWTLTPKAGTFVDQKNVVVRVGAYEEKFDNVGVVSAIKVTTHREFLNGMGYELGSVTAGEVEVATLELTNVNLDEITVFEGKSTINGISLNAEQIKQIHVKRNAKGTPALYVDAALLNAIQNSQKLEIRLTDGDLLSAAASAITAKNPAATASNGLYTLSGNTIKLTLKAEPSQYVAEKLKKAENWKIQMGASSAFTQVNTGVVTVTSVEQGASNKAEFTLTLNIPAEGVTYHDAVSSGSLQIDQTVKYEDSDKTYPLTVDGSTAAMVIEKATVVKAEITEATTNSNKNKVVVKFDLGLTLNEAKALKQEVNASLTTAFEGKTGQSATEITSGNAVTALDVLDTDQGILTLTLTNYSSSTDKFVSIKFLGSKLYNAHEAVSKGITPAL